MLHIHEELLKYTTLMTIICNVDYNTTTVVTSIHIGQLN